MPPPSMLVSSRRSFLRGSAALIGLPFFESLRGAEGSASLHGSGRGLSGAGSTARPVRLAFLYAPNGRNMSQWTPTGTGRGWQLSPTLEPLRALKEQITVISGLDCEMAKAHGDGAGDHSRAAAAYLTGVHPRKTSGSDIAAGTSADQIAAASLGKDTRFPSLELGTDAYRPAGRCDAGYACAYQYNLSWRSATAPAPPEASPRAVFERLFGGGGAEALDQRQARQTQRRSVLDYVREQAQRTAARLNPADRALFSDYQDSIREVERRLETEERLQQSTQHSLITQALQPPPSVPTDFQSHLRLMFDLMSLAFQTDSTRVISFMMAAEASGRVFSHLGAKDPHHTLSHHQGNQQNLDLLAQIDRWYVTELARFLQKLKDTPDGEQGSLLDSSMILYGCGIADGNDHGHENLPTLLAGRGGGTLTPGQHLVLPGAVPVTNLCRTLLTKAGVPTQTLGDSSGLITAL